MWNKVAVKLEVKKTECLCPGMHAHTYAQTDGQPENIMPPDQHTCTG